MESLQVSIRFKEEYVDQLMAAAKAAGCTPTEIVRRLTEAWLKLQNDGALHEGAPWRGRPLFGCATCHTMLHEGENQATWNALHRDHFVVPIAI